jgi:hypothetical protein
LANLELLNSLIARPADIARDLIPGQIRLRHSVAGVQKARTQRPRATQCTEDDLFTRVFPSNDAFEGVKRRVQGHCANGYGCSVGQKYLSESYLHEPCGTGTADLANYAAPRRNDYPPPANIVIFNDRDSRNATQRTDTRLKMGGQVKAWLEPKIGD